MKTACLVFLLCVSAVEPIAQTPDVSQSARSSGDLILRSTNSSQCPVTRVAPQVLPDGRMLLGVSDTVYLVGADGTVTWKFVTKGLEQALTLAAPPAFNLRTNEIGVIGCDLFFVRLDATTGTEKWRTHVNGSSEYRQIAPYGSGFLLVISSHGEDELQYWGDSEEEFRQTDFPSGATLIVSGEKIFAVRNLGSSVRVKELRLHKSRWQ